MGFCVRVGLERITRASCSSVNLTSWSQIDQVASCVVETPLASLPSFVFMKGDWQAERAD
jgi:hypothetical protein